MSKSDGAQSDLMIDYLRHAPISLAIREVNRIFALRQFFSENSVSKQTVLDIGCGDGFWWKAFSGIDLQVYGVDISSRELRQAKLRLRDVELCDISKQRPFSNQQFPVAIGNCSLEHIYDLAGAFGNINRAMSPNGVFILFVPSPFWAHQGHLQKFLMRVSPRTAMMISGAFNGFFQHWHLYDYKIWEKLLEDFGFKVVQRRGLGNRKTDFLFRLFLPSAFVGFLLKGLFGIYPNRVFKIFPRFTLTRIATWIQRPIMTAVTELPSDFAYEYMIVARKATTNE